MRDRRTIAGSGVSRVTSSRWLRGALGLSVLAFCAAPVPGDVGGCNQRAEELDPGAFLAAKAELDCQQCRSCGLESEACARACAGILGRGFPEGCVALVHDGEVCLRALSDASCDDSAAYLRDRSPTTPTECNFCPRSAE